MILKVTGSTVCGSDLHLLHGTVIQMQKGDILGHEFCGVVESMGKDVKGIKTGDRVVASFQIACGDVSSHFPRTLYRDVVDDASVSIARRRCHRNASGRILIRLKMACMEEEPQVCLATRTLLEALRVGKPSM